MGMRSQQHAPPRRRPAAEWTRLVAELHASGLSPEQFAASRGVPLARLRWWKWHLGGRQRSPSNADELRLLPVVVEPTPAPVAASPSAAATPAWELCTSGGDVLRVYRATAPAEIQAALAALMRRGGRW
jgi:hypothetical protein